MSEEIETGVSHIAYFRTNGGSSKLYTQEYVDDLQKQLQQKDNIIKDIKAQLDYLETYSSKEDVFEDMKRRLDKIEKIIDKENK